MDRFRTLAALLVLAGSGLYCRISAQTAGSGVYSLKDCMEYAVSNSTEIRIRQADNSDLRISRRNAILAAFTPDISANASAYSNFGRAIDPETNTYITTASFSNSYGISAGITLFNGFQAVNNLRISRTAEAMGLSQEQQIRDRICLATIEAYYNVVYYSGLAEILESDVMTAEESLRLVSRQEELGQKSRSDVTQARADLADREYQLTDARNRLSDAYITLKDIMFWPIGDNLVIDCGHDGIPILEDSIDSCREFSGEEGSKDENRAGTTVEIIENAKGFLPSASIAKGNLENARLELRTARWQLAPSLSLSGGWSTDFYTYPGRTGYQTGTFAEQFRDNSGEYIRLSMSIPIFGRLSRQSAIARKRNALRRATASYEQTMRDIEAEVLRAISDMKGAAATLRKATGRAEVQEEAFRLNRRKFEQGLISPIEYRTASDNRLQSQAERLNALLQYDIKRRVVDYYNGIPYLLQD